MAVLHGGLPPTITEDESNLTSRAAGVGASTPVVARPFDTRRCSSVSAARRRRPRARARRPRRRPPRRRPRAAAARRRPSPRGARALRRLLLRFAVALGRAARGLRLLALAFFAALSSALLGPPLKSTISSFFFAVPVTASICDMVRAAPVCIALGSVKLQQVLNLDPICFRNAGGWLPRDELARDGRDPRARRAAAARVRGGGARRVRRRGRAPARRGRRAARLGRAAAPARPRAARSARATTRAPSARAALLDPSLLEAQYELGCARSGRRGRRRCARSARRSRTTTTTSPPAVAPRLARARRGAARRARRGCSRRATRSAVAAHRDAARLRPRHARCHERLGRALHAAGAFGGAAAELREPAPPGRQPRPRTARRTARSARSPTRPTDGALGAYERALPHARAHGLAAALALRGDSDDARELGGLAAGDDDARESVDARDRDRGVQRHVHVPVKERVGGEVDLDITPRAK